MPDSDALFVKDLSGAGGHHKIWRVDLVGGSAQPLAEEQPYLSTLAVASGHVYWGSGDESGGQLVRAPKGGGPAEVVARAASLVYSLAATKSGIVFATGGRPGEAQAKGSLYFFEPSSKAVTTMVDGGLDAPFEMAVQNDQLYWVEKRKLMRFQLTPRSGWVARGGAG